MTTNIKAFTPDIIRKIANYKDEHQGLGRKPDGGYFVHNGSIMFYENSPDNVIIETTLNHFDGNNYYIADLIYGETAPDSMQELSVELLEKY